MEIQKEIVIGKQRILRGLFVIRSQSGKFSVEIEKKLSDQGVVREIEQYSELILLEIADEDVDVRRTWEKLQEELGEGFDVFPVILDDEGNQKYPIGRIAMRFREPLSDDELAAFAKEHELSSVERNEYTQKQIAFGIGQKFLPELLENLQAENSNVRSWAETISAFKRGN